MSFTQEVKTEICKNELKDCCKKAELVALIQMCSSLTISKKQLFLNIKTQNPTVAKRIFTLLKNLYQVDTQLSMIKQPKFKKKYSYEIKVINEVKDILRDLTLWLEEGLNDFPSEELIKENCDGRAYLAGAFLAGGSINSPSSSNYHWEISCSEKSLASFIIRLLQRYSIKAKIIIRRKNFIVYIKQSEKIGDFLRLVGAYESLMKFEDARIQRDYVNSMYRLDNCDIANEIKIQKSALKQIEDIKVVMAKNKGADLDIKLKEVAELRLENPEVSFLELSQLYEKKYSQRLSKSGIRHRLNRIKTLANKQ